MLVARVRRATLGSREPVGRATGRYLIGAPGAPLHPVGRPVIVRFFVSLGSNLDDRHANIDRAVCGIRDLVDAVVHVSTPIETAPMYLVDQPEFINAVACFDADIEPRRLLDLLLRLERRLGRVRGERFGPRIIDSDILAADDLVIREDDLEIPHPRMHERAFVLGPLAELAPEWVHPSLELTAEQMLVALTDPQPIEDAG